MTHCVDEIRMGLRTEALQFVVESVVGQDIQDISLRLLRVSILGTMGNESYQSSLFVLFQGRSKNRSITFASSFAMALSSSGVYIVMY